MRTSRQKILGGIALLASTSLGAGSTGAQAAEPFRCKPGEKYVMNVMVSGVEYWFPVYEMFKQAGQQLGCETAYTGTPEYDVNKQIASFDQALAQNPAGILVHPMNSDPFIEPINRADRRRARPCHLRGRFADLQAHLLHHLRQHARRHLCRRRDRRSWAARANMPCSKIPGQDNHDKRIAAFIARMEDKWPDMKLVGRAASNQDPTKAYQAVLMSIVQANPEPRRRVHAGGQLGHRCGAGQQGNRRQDSRHVLPTSTPTSST